MTAIELSNYVINHLFWKNYEMQYFSDLVKNIRALRGMIKYDRKNPSCCTLSCITHDTNVLMTYIIDSKTICREEIQVLQTYVQLMYSIVNKKEIDSPIGYLYRCEKGEKEREIMKFVSVNNEDGTYRAVRLIETPEKLKEIIDGFKQDCKNYEKIGRKDSAVYKLYKSEILRLVSGEKITDCIKYIGEE
jgi:hypothetical protein